MRAMRHEQDLLSTRICDLELGPGARWLERQVAVVYGDLAAAGLTRFRPRVYLGDEWFSPAGLPAIAAPFYLGDERLMRLERLAMRAPVEGGSALSCRRLLRHEAGHSFDHAYKVAETPAFARVFGDPTKVYDPDAFLPDRRSSAFVRHLPGSYAQAHPDEDFAETFAVVVTPGLAARARRGAPSVLVRKLRFVEDLIARWGDRAPLVRDDGSTCYAAERMRTTLGRYYERRLAEKRRAAARVKRLTAARA